MWTGPVAELKAFAKAALVTPVPRDHTESDTAFRRRRIVAAITLAAGGLLLWYSLQIEPGNPAFYLATFALAGVWAVGALASGPLHLGRAWTRTGTHQARPAVQALALAGLLICLFLAGAVVISRIPLLREPVDALLDHARYGSPAVITAVVVANGIAEEMYFRGALYAAVGRRWARHAVAVTTVVYALTTISSGVPLLVLAAALLGVLTGLQRRVTGGILGPIVLHITWSAAMLWLLPAVLDALR